MPDAPSFEKLSACVHCGLCLESCPTYRELGVEMDSPRGRLYLMKGILGGRIEATETALLHLDRCLECRACETACPSGVEYGPILEKTRTLLEEKRLRPLHVRFLRGFLFRFLLPSRSHQRWLFNLLWLQQALGLAALGRWLGRHGLLPGRLASAAAQAPCVPFRCGRGLLALSEPRRSPDVKSGSRRESRSHAESRAEARSHSFPARGPRRHRVALFTGCLADFLLPEVTAAAVRVLTESGCDVDILTGEACCGALHIHNGDREYAKTLARANVAEFAPGHYDFIVNTAAGCGAELRHYGDLLDGDPAAAAFGGRVRDITEVLAEIAPKPSPDGGIRPLQGTLRGKVAYDEPCHLLHAQKVSAPPKALLKGVPGLDLVPLEDADACCGSAGIYSIVQPELARRVLARKIDAIRRSGAEVVATGNPGCILQIRAGLREAGLPIRVAHPVELAAEAYGRGNRR